MKVSLDLKRCAYFSYSCTYLLIKIKFQNMLLLNGIYSHGREVSSENAVHWITVLFTLSSTFITSANECIFQSFCFSGTYNGVPY